MWTWSDCLSGMLVLAGAAVAWDLVRAGFRAWHAHRAAVKAKRTTIANASGDLRRAA